jgi:hypothetical protein
LWDLSTGKCIKKLEVDSGRDLPRVLVLEDRLISFRGDSIDNETRRIWDPSTEQCLGSLKACTGYISTANFSPDGDKLVLRIEKTIQVWDLSTGQCSQTFQLNTDLSDQIVFSLDGNKLAVPDNRIVHLWSLSTGEHLQTLQGHANWVRLIHFSNNGKLLASASGHPASNWTYSRFASNGNSLRLWNPLTGDCIYTLEDIPAITSLSFSDDDQCLNTSLGNLRLDRSSGSLKGQQYGLFVRRQWITFNGQNILWLPPEFRARFTAVCGNVVVLVCISGQMVFLDFALD